jgi:D-arabinose 1-dehydrogenase-like Zn-dependent alcohol dehydrogenase
VVLIGAGGLGLMAIRIHKALKGKAVISVDIDRVKLDAARKAGATAAINANDADAAKQIRDAAGGAVWTVIDLVGSSATAQLGVDCLTKGGKLIIVGLFGGQITIPVPLIPQRAMTIQGSYVGNLKELVDLLALVRKHKIPPIPIHQRPLADAHHALEDLRAGKVIGRTVLVP